MLASDIPWLRINRVLRVRCCTHWTQLGDVEGRLRLDDVLLRRGAGARRPVIIRTT
jgi:hypothetical protein